MKNLQREALTRRPELLAKYTAWAQANGRTFTRIMGSADRAFELLVLETPWVFWMTLAQRHCRSLPPVRYPGLFSARSFDGLSPGDGTANIVEPSLPLQEVEREPDPFLARGQRDPRRGHDRARPGICPANRNS